MVVLASSSPQRKVLLEQIGIHPVIVPAHIDEWVDTDNISVSLKDLAFRKAKAALAKINTHGGAMGAKSADGFWIIAADTVILLDGKIFGKAQTPRDAGRTLRLLSGRAHRVLSGVFAGRAGGRDSGVYTLDERISTLSETVVEFNSLSDGEIAWYLSTGEWREAAGAYRIQGKGACLVAGINGSFSNVVGLPLEQIYGMLVRLEFVFQT